MEIPSAFTSLNRTWEFCSASLNAQLALRRTNSTPSTAITNTVIRSPNVPGWSNGTWSNNTMNRHAAVNTATDADNSTAWARNVIDRVVCMTVSPGLRQTELAFDLEQGPAFIRSRVGVGQQCGNAESTFRIDCARHA